ncbi:MAG: fatty acyl-AMP ligase [Pseudomonadota bacterium]
MNTIVDILRERAERTPGRVAYRFLGELGEETSTLTDAQLALRAQAVALALSRYPRQARVLIALPTSPGFCDVFFGCLLAGKVAVPVPVPTAHRMQAAMAIARECDAACLVTLGALVQPLRAAAIEAGLPGMEILDVEGLQERAPCDSGAPQPADLAFLQFTSGSTGSPKGVMVTHGNIMANERMIRESFGHTPESRVVGWVPLYHDQGLVGNLIQPLYVGAECILMAPLTFLSRPLVWLQAMTRYAATTSGGPNFCYDHCVERIPEQACAGLNLRHWKVAFNGAEPISAATLRRFSARFAPYGFEPTSFLLCYGMAEASLYVSGGHLQDLSSTQAIDSGVVHPEISVVFRPAHAGEPSLGQEICVAGPNVTPGYWGGRDKESFFVRDGKTYFRTGDVGHMRGGRLVVSGRIKEMMIVRGRKVYPYDIERTVTEAHDAFLAGGCAVVTVGAEERQDVVAVQEVERTARHALDYHALAGMVRKSVVRLHDVQIKRIFFAKPGFIPKTSSGKIRRTLLARQLQDAAHDPKIIATM